MIYAATILAALAVGLVAWGLGAPSWVAFLASIYTFLDLRRIDD